MSKNACGSVSSNDKLLSEWDFDKNEGLDPYKLTLKSEKRAWWSCLKKKHSWNSIIHNRAKGSDCPYCYGRLAIKGETDIATTNPELLTTWDDEKNQITPEEITARSDKKVWWTCEEHGSYIASPHSRLRGNGCPGCSDRVRHRTYFII